MIKKDYPSEGELVVCTAKNVQNFGAFVTLDEYPNREGFIHIAEIATGWVKRVRNHIREKQKVVCKVMNVDKEKNHIDLSLKRVNEHQRRDKIQDWKNSQKAEKLFEMVAKELGEDTTNIYNEFGKNLEEKYGTLYAAFEETAYDKEILKKDGYKGDWVEKFVQIAKANIPVQFVDIRGYIKVNCWLPDGIEHIKNALLEAEKSEYEDVEIKIKYIGAPNYMITVKAPDYKIAEEEMKKATEKIKTHMKNHNGEFEFQRKQEK
jgi:translation initiation factor 2 subunit 1